MGILCTQAGGGSAAHGFRPRRVVRPETVQAVQVSAWTWKRQVYGAPDSKAMHRTSTWRVSTCALLRVSTLSDVQCMLQVLTGKLALQRHFRPWGGGKLLQPPPPPPAPVVPPPPETPVQVQHQYCVTCC